LYCDILQEDVESIVGGQFATEIRPYLVALGRGEDSFNGQTCGGSLISPRAVLTAAHCITDRVDGSLRPVEWVEFNRLDLTAQNEPGAVRINVGAPNQIQIPHPRYNTVTEDLDVAVIILPRAMAMDGITPVTLNEDSSVPADGALLDVAGWGDTTNGEEEFSSVLKFTTLEYITNGECTSAPFQYPPEDITNNMMCAFEEGTDSCQGDSGKCHSS